MIFPNKTYDKLKWIAGVVLPAIAALYVGFGEIWVGVLNLPYPAQVSATIMLFVTFVDTLLGISAIQYGKIVNNNLPESTKAKVTEDDTEA